MKIIDSQSPYCPRCLRPSFWVDESGGKHYLTDFRRYQGRQVTVRCPMKCCPSPGCDAKLKVKVI